jgi:phosphopentomutase
MTQHRKRAFLIVLDSVGCGALPDAPAYGDSGVNTLGHIAAAVGGLHVPTLQSLGLGNIIPLEGVAPEPEPLASYGKMAEASAGKDTTTGHWELMGLTVEQPFPTYPQGFPADVMEAFTHLTGYGYLGNVAASGTAIINDLGPEHLQTGKPIIYTSADSVFQIAAHSDVIDLNELYRICTIAREQVLTGDHAVARVIARPFEGSVEAGFKRTPMRHDYSLRPFAPTLLDRLQQSSVPTLGIGKINDIFAGQGVGESVPTRSNEAGMDALAHESATREAGFVFANLVDFDMLWGHRRDVAAYARGLETFDSWLAGFIVGLRDSDLLVITADHGCDPTFSGSDHTREYVPLLVYGDGYGNERVARDLGVHPSFSEVATIIGEYFGS